MIRCETEDRSNDSEFQTPDIWTGVYSHICPWRDSRYIKSLFSSYNFVLFLKLPQLKETTDILIIKQNIYSLSTIKIW